MANEYGTLPDLKLRLNIETSDTTRDTLLNSALAAASRAIDKACGRRFWLDAAPVQRTFRVHGRVSREPDGDLLLVDDIGDAAGLIAETGGGGVWSAVSGYETAPENALADGLPVTGLRLLYGSWGIGTARVRVTARFGWPAVPDEIAEATVIQAARLYRRKDSPDGITGSAEWGVVRLSRRDPDVWNLIEPFILPGFA